MLFLINYLEARYPNRRSKFFLHIKWLGNILNGRSQEILSISGSIYKKKFQIVQRKYGMNDSKFFYYPGKSNLFR